MFQYIPCGRFADLDTAGENHAEGEMSIEPHRRHDAVSTSVLRTYLQRFGRSPANVDGWDGYEPLLASIISGETPKALMEIGGGRSPLFSIADLERLTAGKSIRYCVNDISASELARLPTAYDTACFDIAGDDVPEEHIGRYDLVFAKMVLEHVNDGERAWRNIATLLRPGGLALSFHPVLYAPPFMANYLLPDRLAAAIVRRLYPHRSDEGDAPVFPARYSQCYAVERWIRPMLLRSGFSDAGIEPFWANEYFDRFPGLRQLSNGLQSAFERLNWTAMASYTYILARR
jgi:SAM-dependent methyltransferase